MANDTIKCPKCETVIDLTDILRKKVAKEVEQEFERKMQKEINRATLESEEALEQLKDELQKAQDNELELRRQKADLDSKTKSLELEVQRKIDSERSRIFEEAARSIDVEHRAKDAEKDRKISDALHQVEELKRKMEQGSQQAQGETLEVELEELLRATFPLDSIEPVAKGVKGGDMVHAVRIRSGQECGKILWEVKRTKAWSDGWVTKIKADARASKCDICLIATETLPKNLKTFGEIEGVWVSSPENCIQLVTVLRQSLVQIAREKYLQTGKKDKATLVYDYLIGQEFRGKVESILESYRTMKADLEGERRATEKLFAKREKQISQVILAVAGFHGELEALTGPELPKIELLELS